MTFIACEERKNSVKESLIRTSPRLRKVKRVGNAILFCSIGFCVLYVASRCIFPFISHIDSSPVAAWKSILGLCTAVLCTGLMSHLVFMSLLDGMTRKNISDRTDESLVLSRGVLRYSFCKKGVNYKEEQLSFDVLIPETDIEYAPEEKCIIFKGPIPVNKICGANSPKHLKPQYVRELLIYDYFEPSLFTFVCRRCRSLTFISSGEMYRTMPACKHSRRYWH